MAMLLLLIPKELCKNKNGTLLTAIDQKHIMILYFLKSDNYFIIRAKNILQPKNQQKGFYFFPKKYRPISSMLF